MTNDIMTPHKWAYKLTRILNAYAGLEHFPINIRDIAKDFSHHQYPDDPISKIKGASLPGFEGGLFKAPSDKKGWGIIYNNSIASKGRINFTLAHEFGHYLLHRLDYPNGIECGEQDLVRWDSNYAKIEHEANVFAANLLMPLDDYRKQINASTKIILDMITHCADRYDVSLIAATLRWIEYTERRAVIVVSREGFILWARSSTSAWKSGIFFRTANCAPVAIPNNSLAAGRLTTDNKKIGVRMPAGVWFKEPCEEIVVFSEQYDFVISVLQLEQEVYYSAE